MANNKFKTISELEQESYQERYYHKNTYIQSWALTTFLKQMEDRYHDFKLLAAHPYIMLCKDDEAVEMRQFCLGTWASWLLKDMVYYLELPANISSDARFVKKPDHRDTPLPFSLYRNIGLFTCNKQTHDILVQNMWDIFTCVKERELIIPSQKDSTFDIHQQTIYTHFME